MASAGQNGEIEGNAMATDTETDVVIEGEGGEGTDTDSDEVTVSIGGEEPEPSEDEKELAVAPQWVKDLRKKQRETERENRELKKKLAAPVAAVTTETVDAVGAKPTLENPTGSPEDAYDADKYEAALLAWQERKQKVTTQAAEKQKAVDEANKAWQTKLDAYGKSKTELKVKDFTDAEDLLKDALSTTQQGVIIHGAENPALVVYALGKNPKKAKELAAIADPVKFAFAVAKLETQLKVTPRKTTPLPEKTVTGSAPVSGGKDSALERLRAAAEKSGDYTEVNKYKQQLKQKQK